MKKKFIKLMNKVDRRDLRACMCCKEVCKYYGEDNWEECDTCPINDSANFKELLKELKE